MIKHFISLKHFSKKQIQDFIRLSAELKKSPKKYNKSLFGKYIGLLFEKPSLRTKTAFYVGTLQLGAQPIYYGPDEIQLGKREKICDIGRTFSRYLDAVVLRTFSHENILEFVKFSTIPVINALSDLLHPSQILGDLLTISELKGELQNLKVGYIGDGNNVCNSLIYAFSILGGNLYIANPKNYSCPNGILDEANKFAEASGANIVAAPIAEAAKNADILYTDVWTSMGKEKEHLQRKKAFKKFQLNEGMLASAKRDCIVMHCLPAHRGEEITDSVMEDKHSVVFQQAENRLYAAKAILLYCLNADRCPACD